MCSAHTSPEKDHKVYSKENMGDGIDTHCSVKADVQGQGGIDFDIIM